MSARIRNTWNHKVLLLHNLTPSYSRKRLIHVSSNLLKVPNSLKGKSQSSQQWLKRQLNDPYVLRAHELNYRARSAFKLIEIDDKARILKPGQTVIECGAAPGAWTQVAVKRINSDGRAKKKRIGTIIGIDLLPIAPLEGAILLSGHDFTETATLQRIREILLERNERVQHGKAFVSEVDRNRIVSPEATFRDEADPHNRAEKVLTASETDPGTGGEESQKYLVDVIMSDMAPNATGQRATDHPRIVKLVEKALEFAVENGKVGGHFLAKVWDGGDTKRLEDCVSRFYDKVSRHKPPSSRNDSSELFIVGKYKK